MSVSNKYLEEGHLRLSSCHSTSVLFSQSVTARVGLAGGLLCRTAPSVLGLRSCTMGSACKPVGRACTPMAAFVKVKYPFVCSQHHGPSKNMAIGFVEEINSDGCISVGLMLDFRID